MTRTAQIGARSRAPVRKEKDHPTIVDLGSVAQKPVVQRGGSFADTAPRTAALPPFRYDAMSSQNALPTEKAVRTPQPDSNHGDKD